jgi:predicted nuclease of predicted toxin-antitoxin system
VRFLVDANLSPRVASLLASAGHDAVTVRDVGLASASDDDVLEHASSEERILVSHDTDFGALLAYRGLTAPSFILFRSSDPITPDEQAALIVANLEGLTGELEAGAIVVFARGRLRVRRLPVR